MPDPLRKTVSASQMAALFGVSPYLSRWMLFRHFYGDALPLREPDERMSWGVMLQDAIMRQAAYLYRARLLSNTETGRYIRRGRIGHTRDGRLIASGRGRVNVEAKNVDFLQWKAHWSETNCPQWIEIQAEVGTYVDRCDLTVVAALVAGNDLKLYERAPNLELQERMRAEVAAFFESVRKGDEPDPVGLPIELPMLAQAWPQVDEGKILERLEDPDLRDLLLQYDHGHQQEAYGRRVMAIAKPKILALAQDCSMVRANSIEARVAKTAVPPEEVVHEEVLFAAQAVRAWARIHYSEDMGAWPAELRKLAYVLSAEGKGWREHRRAHIRQQIITYRRHWDAPLPGDDIVERLQQEEIAP